jgi:Abnormal spindle-like microcephaly-assoc'd, ASPM-SPD-2-Hydin
MPDHSVLPPSAASTAGSNSFYPDHRSPLLQLLDIGCSGKSRFRLGIAALLIVCAAGMPASFWGERASRTSSISLSASSLSFGSQAIGTASASQSVTLTNTGRASTTITSIEVTGTNASSFVSQSTCGSSLAAKASCVIQVHFSPAAAGAMTAAVSIVDSAKGSPQTISLSGTGTSTPTLSALSCSASTMSSSGTDACTVTLSAESTGSSFNVDISSSSSSVTVPAVVTVPANASSAAFTATVSSISAAQTVTLTASAGSVSKTFALTLSPAIATLSVNASTVAFGDVQVSAPATQQVTLTSTGTAAVTVSSATIAGAGFSVSGATFPLTLNSGQSAVLSVQFDPSASGAVTGQLTIDSNSSSGSTTVVSLTGTGMAVSYMVNLTWSAPASSPDPVAGYNIYRSPSGSSTYQLLGSVSTTQLAFTDNGVTNGQTYDYMVESVDASGNESTPSNVAAVIVP